MEPQGFQDTQGSLSSGNSGPLQAKQASGHLRQALAASVSLGGGSVDFVENDIVFLGSFITHAVFNYSFTNTTSSVQKEWKSLTHVQLCDPMDYISPWNSPGQNTGVGSLSLLQGIFSAQGGNPGLLHCRRILFQRSHQGQPGMLDWVACPFSRDLPNPGIEMGSPALQAGSLPAGLQGSPKKECSIPFNPGAGMDYGSSLCSMKG